ncbi:MAG: hypothetical protein EOM90_14280 [Alphaproteobacteria bacterium]|nr:hypothetical protein [Alphaproteobacteria bacterium]
MEQVAATNPGYSQFYSISAAVSGRGKQSVVLPTPTRVEDNAGWFTFFSPFAIEFPHRISRSCFALIQWGCLPA